MRYVVLLSMSLLLGCAATAPTSDDSLRFHTSDRALAIIEEQGKASATMLGFDADTDLVCERFYKTGSHITTRVCYTRAEMEQRRLDHQETYRGLANRSALCVEGDARPGLSPYRVTPSNRGGTC